MADFTIKQNDTWPPLDAVLSDSNGPLNLTGCSVKILAKNATGTASWSATCEITGPVTGNVRHNWRASDTASKQTFNVEWEITWPNLTTSTVPNKGYKTVEVVADLG